MSGRCLGRTARIFSRLGFLFWVAAIGIGATVSASAQDRRQNTPGEFDFYVLSLSWSPSFCEEAAERGNSGRSQQVQCGGRPFSFVVHGLWPQYERGFPEYCDRDSWLDRNIMTSMLDLMPAPGLIFNEWKKHGTCSGLGARGYFETIRKGPRGREDSTRIHRPCRPENHLAGRHRRCLHQGQSGSAGFRHRGDLQPLAAERSPHLHGQGFAIPRLRRDRPPRLPARPGDDAAGARRMKRTTRGGIKVFRPLMSAYPLDEADLTFRSPTPGRVRPRFANVKSKSLH